MTYDNYLGGGSPTYANAMPGAQAPAKPPQPQQQPMTLAEWAAYFKALSPEDQAAFANQVQGINWNLGNEGGGNPLSKLMGMFGKSKTGEGG